MSPEVDAEERFSAVDFPAPLVFVGKLSIMALLYFGKGDACPMPTIQISLPEPLRQFVQSRVVELGLDHSDQYFEQLLEEERRKKIDE